jgi:hypothetical protein
MMRPTPRRDENITSKDLRRALIEGLLLPIRLYFQPGKVIDESTQRRTGLSSDTRMMLNYCCSLLWVLFTAVIAWIIFGPPPMNVATLVVPMFFIALGGMSGTSIFVHNNQPSSATFNISRAVAIGTVLNSASVLYLFFLAGAARQEHVEIAVAADQAFQSGPVLMIAGIVFGLVLALVFGTRGTPREVVLVGIIFGAFFVVTFMIAGATTGNGDFGLKMFLPATLVMTHLIFQPVYFVISAVSSVLLSVDTSRSPLLWRISPANWSEFAYVPLVGLKRLLISHYQTDTASGLRAVNQVKRHPFYKRIGERASKEIYSPGTES